MKLWDIEQEYRTQGYSIICGTDEAGAGPLAGPVYAAAVILPFELEIKGLNDSKKVSPKKRETLFSVICEAAEAYAIVSIDETEIDETDILRARLKAMDLAVKQLSIRPDLALIDGNRDQGIECPHALVVEGDSKSANIAAASILAKVSRDRFMVEMDSRYPGYGFAKHKGYGTPQHFEALRRLGPCPLHRRTFLKNL
ncbi:MAG: Ribonuclease [Oscillospiraceae bacterium]|nr:Ribonuclease [Oscillospiraceae bacterium]